MNKTTIFVVYKEDGEYSDYTKETICAIRDKSLYDAVVDEHVRISATDKLRCEKFEEEYQIWEKEHPRPEYARGNKRVKLMDEWFFASHACSEALCQKNMDWMPEEEDILEMIKKTDRGGYIIGEVTLYE